MLLTLANISPIPFPPLLTLLLSSMSERSAVLTMPSEALMCSGFTLECQAMLSAFPHPHSQAWAPDKGGEVCLQLVPAAS